jgi:hypothetical protein
MSVTRVPIGRLAAVAALAVGAIALAQNARGPHWHSLAPGIEFATIRGEPYCRSGSSTIAIVRFDPVRIRLRVLHYSSLPGRVPAPIATWLDHTQALAVTNAGQYYPDYSYMGLLVSDGRKVSAKMHPAFQALLVAEPDSEKSRARGAERGIHRPAQARVIDLDRDTLDLSIRWREVAQSFMLFGRNGETRVRRSDQVANRTVVAEDREGRMVIVTSEGGYTLRDLASVLQEAPLGLTQAMAMDGGHEAQLCVRAGNFRYASFGRWRPEDERPAAWDVQVPLPAVVVLESR